MAKYYQLEGTCWTAGNYIDSTTLSLPKEKDWEQVYSFRQYFEGMYTGAYFDSIDELLAALKTVEKYDRDYFLIDTEFGPFQHQGRPHYKLFARSNWEESRKDVLVDTGMIIQVYGSEED